MTTLTEIEAAVAALSPEQKYTLYRHIETQLQDLSRKTSAPRRQSVLDISPVHLGPILQPLTSGDDLLGEMLETRESHLDAPTFARPKATARHAIGSYLLAGRDFLVADNESE